MNVLDLKWKMSLFLLTDCLTTSAHSGGTPYSGFSCRNRLKSFRGGAKAPPIYEEETHALQTTPSTSIKCAHKIYKNHLASISPVDDLHSLFSCQAVDVNFIRVSAAMSLLFWSAILKLQLVCSLQNKS